MDTKYWNMIDDVVDQASLLAEDKPVAKAIIGTIDKVVESKETGIDNKSAFEIIKTMAKSKWNDVKDADLEKIAEIIGEDVEVEFKTDASQKDTGWLGKLWHYLAMLLGFVKPMIANNEVKRIVGYAETLVKAKDNGISNEAFKETLVAMSKSAWNSIDSDKIKRIMAIINK